MKVPGILLVEDRQSDIELTLVMLERERILNPVTVVRDGDTAMSYLFDVEQVAPRLVLLDLNLHGYDGLQILNRMRATSKTSTVPVVILTGSEREEDMIDALKVGANSYIRKPLSLLSLARAVQALGMGWLIVATEDVS